MQDLEDGGAIYTLGYIQNSIVRNNYIRDVEKDWGGLYPDQASRDIDWTDNVVAQTVRWMNMWASDSRDMVVTGNFSDNDDKALNGVNITASNNQENLTSWPAAAQAIIDASGLESAYADIRVVQGSNLALAATATSSSDYSWAHTAAKAIDGTASTGWSPLGVTADVRPWLQLDLGQPMGITRLEFVSRPDVDHSTTRRNFEIQASNDPSFATYAVLEARGSTPFAHAATSGVFVEPTAPYRYVRIIKTVDSDYLYVAELRVFGAPAPVNAALTATATASSTYNSLTVAAKANDDAIATGWSPLAPASDPLPWLQLDLGSAKVIQEVQFVSRQDTNQSTTRGNFEVQASNDPTFASYVVLGANGSTPFAHQATWSTVPTTSTAYRYVRIIKTVADYLFVAELRVMV